MKEGNKVTLKHYSVFAQEGDRHNPTDIVGEVMEIRKHDELPVVVNWGSFTNSYKFKDLEEV